MADRHKDLKTWCQQKLSNQDITEEEVLLVKEINDLISVVGTLKVRLTTAEENLGKAFAENFILSQRVEDDRVAHRNEAIKGRLWQESVQRNREALQALEAGVRFFSGQINFGKTEYIMRKAIERIKEEVPV